MKDIVTAVVDETFDVRRHLARMGVWQDEWASEDERLRAKLRLLKPDKPLDKQLGRQIGLFRKRSKMMRVREPLEFHKKTLATEEGYRLIRQNLAKQFVSLPKKDQMLWLNNFVFIMTPDLWKLHEKVKKILGYYSLGQQRNFLLGGHSGMGKSTYLNWLSALNVPDVEALRNRVPIIKVDAPVSNASPKTLQRRLLDISNMTQGIPMICASCNPTCWVTGDIEVAGRWNDYFELPQYRGERLSDLLSFIEMLLPFSKESNLALQEVKSGTNTIDGPAKLIEEWTGGILRDIMILIRDASQRAIENDLPCLSPELLGKTWKDIQEERVTDFGKEHLHDAEDE